MQRNAEGLDARPGWVRRAWEWLWLGEALAAARAQPGPDAGRAEPAYAQRARVAFELAERVRDPIDPLRSGSALALSLSLYRQAGYWALCGLGAPPERDGAFAAALDAAPVELLRSAAGSASELSAVRSAFERSFVEDACEDEARLDAQVHTLRAFARALLSYVEPQAAIDRLRVRRGVRLGSVLLLAIAALGFALGRAPLMHGPDLARGKPWRASSTGLTCHPERSECGGANTKIFFHTDDERNPWVEIDLGDTQRIASIEVDNRRDCCSDRAVPLILEVSTDGARFREVARREEPFMTWRAAFDPVKARYVRARVARRSSLHLERVSVYAR